MSNIFSGVITALVTPFNNGEVDFNSLGQLVEHQQSNGIQGFVINGTTAESPTLTAEEVAAIFKFVRNQVGHSMPLIMGTGTNSTRSSIENAKQAQELGADGTLVVCPYYNKPTQRGMVAHFKAIAESTEMPLLLYNVPGRTVVSLSAESVIELSVLKIL
ncbi:MAG: dihydrodipicolinate synthase family protein [Bdellovibrionales bacterium]